MTTSSFIALRQKTAPDCRYRAVSGHVCTVLLQGHPLWSLGRRFACQHYEKNRRVAALKWTQPVVRQVVRSARTSGQLTIAIAAQPIAHRSYIPAVSSLGACLTPA
jgi:hypothetical protein